MKILVATDLSAASVPVLAAVQEHAASTGAETWLLHVAEPDPDFVGYAPGPQSVRNQVATTFRKEHDQLHEHAAAFRAAGINTHALLVQGATGETILSECAKLKATLVVVGSHGRGPLRQMLVGSVSEHVIRHAECPVLVVPTHKNR